MKLTEWYNNIYARLPCIELTPGSSSSKLKTKITHPKGKLKEAVEFTSWTETGFYNMPAVCSHYGLTSVKLGNVFSLYANYYTD